MRSAALHVALALAAASSLARGAESPDEAQRIASGQAVYSVRCASCHGPRGQAAPGWDRPDASGEMPAPPHGPEGHTWKHSDAMLYRIVAQGWRDPFNKTSRLTMPPFSGALTPAEIRDVIDYLKTLWTPEQSNFQREESEHASFPPEALRAP